MNDERKFTVDGLGPIQIKRVKKVLSGLSWDAKGFIEVTSSLDWKTGEYKESRTKLTELITGTPNPQYGVEYQRLFDLVGGIITPANLQAFLSEAEKSTAIVSAACPVRDNRKPEAELRAELEERSTRQEEEKAKREEEEKAFLDVPQGQTVIQLEKCFDDSHMMTDYYHPHVHLETFILGYAPKQAEKEALARRIIARYPELSAYTWTWKTEKYSMGNGNYLISHDPTETVKKQAYDGREEVSVHYEITFTTQSGRFAAPWPTYPGNVHEEAPTPRENVSEKTIRKNTEKNGIEIVFPGKPSVETLDRLKANGWRWSRFSSLWYNRDTAENQTFAEAL